MTEQPSEAVRDFLSTHVHGFECYSVGTEDVEEATLDCPFEKPSVQKIIDDIYEALDANIVGSQASEGTKQSIHSYIGMPVTVEGHVGHVSEATMDHLGTLSFTVTIGELDE